MAVNWDWAFVTFHHIAFDNDYWIFDPATDPVYNILPDTFFLHCALLILAGVVLGSVVCGLVYRKLRRKKVVCISEFITALRAYTYDSQCSFLFINIFQFIL